MNVYSIKITIEGIPYKINGRHNNEYLLRNNYLF